MPDEQREELCEAKSQEAVSRRSQSVRAHEPQRGEVDARHRAGAPSHDDMLDCLANVENADLLKKVVWPIAPRREPESGGLYRGKKVAKKALAYLGGKIWYNKGYNKIVLGVTI